jgi:predicted 3-demethylubiquinone-9 3-methyltransferase (glyoxalase superfamily)
MKNPIYACLWFDGKAQEAAQFYCSVFKNSQIVSVNPMVTIASFVIKTAPNKLFTYWGLFIFIF